MKQIGFRAWWYSQNRFIYPDGMYGDDMQEQTETIALLLAGNMNGCRDEFYEDYELEQFTGLHDKNGKEIYEGDIINWMDGIYVDSVRVDDLHGYRFMFGKEPLCKVHAVDIEVIGNIHQNPELLGK